MKIEGTCPNCGAFHVLESQGIKRCNIQCGCNKKTMVWDANWASPNVRWLTRAGPMRKKNGPTGPILKGHDSGKVVPPDIAKKLREAFGGGTVTGRTPSGKIQVEDLADGELRFIKSQPLKWGDVRWSGPMPYSVGGHSAEEKKNGRFEGHGCPDVRSKLVRQFQDVFGRDE